MSKKKGGKKKGGKKGKNAKNSSGGSDDKLSLEDENKLYKSQIESLKNELIICKSKYSEAYIGMKEFKKHYELLSNEYENEKNKTFLITANMTRQYKLMRDDLINKLNVIKQELNDKNDIINNLNDTIKELKLYHENELKIKNNELNSKTKKMDGMAQEFGEMLKQTLNKMGEKIVIHNEL